jgi:hypothetical protein
MWFAVGSRILPVSLSFGAAERRKTASGYNFIEMPRTSRADKAAASARSGPVEFQ